MSQGVHSRNYSSRTDLMKKRRMYADFLKIQSGFDGFLINILGFKLFCHLTFLMYEEGIE